MVQEIGGPWQVSFDPRWARQKQSYLRSWWIGLSTRKLKSATTRALRPIERLLIYGWKSKIASFFSIWEK